MNNRKFAPLNLCVLVVSDTRDETTDTSGKCLVDNLTTAGHILHEKSFVKDDIYEIRARVSAWVADSKVHGILLTGGTGFAQRDVTPSAVIPLFDKQIPGFGELFRQVSFKSIGTSSMQSSAIAGIANSKVIFCLPGSKGACTEAWNALIKEQLDNRHSPCNFIMTVLKSAAQV